MNKLSNIQQCLTKYRKSPSQSICLKHQQPIKSICTNHSDLIHLCERCKQCCHPTVPASNMLQCQIQLQLNIKNSIGSVTKTVDMFPLLSNHFKTIVNSIKKLTKMSSECQGYKQTIGQSIDEANIMQLVNRCLQNGKQPDSFMRKQRLLRQLQPICNKIIKNNNSILSSLQKQLKWQRNTICKSMNEAIQLIDRYICSIDQDSVAVNSDEDDYHRDRRMTIQHQYAISIKNTNIIDKVKKQLRKSQYDNYLLRQRVQFFEQQTAHRQQLMQQQLQNCMILWYGNINQQKPQKDLKDKLVKVQRQYSAFLIEYEKQKELLSKLVEEWQVNSMLRRYDSSLTDTTWLIQNIQGLEGTIGKIRHVATQHKCSTKDYHRNCDNLKQYLVIIKTESGLVLGGCVLKKASYIFSISRQIILNHLGKSPPIVSQSYYGPIFGMGDIRVTADSVISHNHTINRGYEMKKIQGLDQRDVLVMGGCQKLVDYQVFQVIDPVEAS